MKRGTFIGDQVLIKEGFQQLTADLRRQKTAKSRALSAKRQELSALSRQHSAPDLLLLAAYCHLPTSFFSGGPLPWGWFFTGHVLKIFQEVLWQKKGSSQ